MEISFIIIGLLVGLIFGAIVAWLISKQKYGSNSISESEFKNTQNKIIELNTNISLEKQKNSQLERDLIVSKEAIELKENEIRSFSSQIAKIKNQFEFSENSSALVTEELNKLKNVLNAEIDAKIELKTNLARVEVDKKNIENQFFGLKENHESLNQELKTINNALTEEKRSVADVSSNNRGLMDKIKTQKETIEELTLSFKNEREELKITNNELNDEKRKVAKFSTSNIALVDKLKDQNDSIEKLNEKFNLEFENIANKILKEKTETFTNVNKINLETILKPLGEDIEKFKQKVNEVYNNESKERFSLGKEIEKLLVLNQQLSEDAHNLTHALKGDPKAQGNWGEMILESILEKSGLTKGQEYFLENYLKDDLGNYLFSDKGTKMRPDAVIQYPDDRKVLIDSKVSLNAFTRLVETNDSEKQKLYIKEHMVAIKKHIITLSNRGYDDLDKSLDFVMMFIPNEPAFMIALKEDPDLWHFAYEKRILLISPTNLITALKLISELWKREYQNQNTQEIVERGSQLYDKFVGFTNNLKDVGDNIDKAKISYEKAYNQLATSPGNLVGQAEKMRILGLKNKKNLKPDFLNENMTDTFNASFIK